MNNLLKNRNTPRILRLAGGIGLGIYAVAAHEPLLWILAGFFLLQALLNVSCCGAGGCSADGGKTGTEVCRDQIKPYKPNNE